MNIPKKPSVKHMLLGSGVLGVVGLATLAVGQIVAPPEVSITHTTDLIQIIPNGQNAATNIYATPQQLANVPGYVKEGNIAANFTATFGNTQVDMILSPTGNISGGGNITMAAAPSDGQRACILSTKAIAATEGVLANTGQTLNNTVTSFSAGVPVCWTYSASNATWDLSP